jgi:hypothetical protein
MPEVLACPDPVYGAPARIVDRWTLGSTDGPDAWRHRGRAGQGVGAVEGGQQRRDSVVGAPGVGVGGQE